MKMQLATGLEEVTSLGKDAKKRDRERRSQDVTGSVGPSGWRAEINNYWEKVKNEGDGMEERAEVAEEKLGDLESLVNKRAGKQNKKVAKEFGFADFEKESGQVLPEGVKLNYNGALAKMIKILKEKSLRRLGRLEGELNDATEAFEEGLVNLKEEAIPHIAEYYKDLLDQAREAGNNIEGDAQASSSALDAAKRTVDSFKNKESDLTKKKDDLKEERNKERAKLEEEVGGWQTSAKAQLKAYLQEEKEKLDDLAQQYELKVEEEERNRFGDGFEEPGRIKTVNDKWTADQQDL